MSKELPLSDDCLRHPAAPVKKEKLPSYLHEHIDNGKHLKPKKPKQKDVEIQGGRVPEWMEEE